ncbi:death domain-containing protein CRADD-like [Patella vulgata]|uniref:death domain-containing protein CRADD-like n=1 Tax=Patella vulgata TaxID=6465 RepID=UPI002180842F|nr:death domain-containing protein CRADD-like [Patella vulgata]
MNAIQKSVLKRQTPKIAEGIIMNEDILSALLANEIFQSSMIDIIRAESTPTNRAYKMLELLPKRGPEAFSGFIDIIQKDYPWLATSLQSEVDHVSGSSKKTENILNDIRKKVRTFVHKQFGQSKKLAEKDKKLITNWMTDQITNERLRLQSISAR